MVEGKQRSEVRAIALSAGAHTVERAAAHALQQYLGRMDGRELPVFQSNDPALPGQGLIFVAVLSAPCRQMRLNGLCINLLPFQCIDFALDSLNA